MNVTVYMTICLLWMAHFLVDVMIGFWPVYKTMAHLDLAVAGLISAGCVLAGEGMQVVFGSMSDRGYRKVLVVIGLVIASASSLLAYTENYYLLFFLLFLTFLGSGAFHPSAASMIGSLSPHRKGLLITIFASGGAFGLGASQLIFSHSFYYFEGHTAILALPFIALAACFALFPTPSFQPQKSSGHTFFDFKTIKSFFQRSDLRSLYICQVCTQTILWGLVFLLPDVLIAREYDSWISLGGGNLFLILGGAFMVVPAGYLADKFTSRLVILGASISSFLLFYVFLFSPMLSVPLLLSLLFILGASLGAINPVSVALGARLAPDNPGLVSAFLMGLVWCVSEGLGQGGGGLLTKLFIEDAPVKALAVIGAAFVVGVATALQLPAVETPAVQTEEEVAS